MHRMSPKSSIFIHATIRITDLSSRKSYVSIDLQFYTEIDDNEFHPVTIDGRIDNLEFTGTHFSNCFIRPIDEPMALYIIN
jgi:hypothetical protein